MSRIVWRVGRHQPQNVYRGDQYVGVMFSADDAALVVETLNDRLDVPSEDRYEPDVPSDHYVTGS